MQHEKHFGMSFKKQNNFKMSAGSRYDPMNFNASQIPDNPGYMDFSDPTPPLPQNKQNIGKRPAQQNQQKPQQQQQQQAQQSGTRSSQRNKKLGAKNKQVGNINNDNNANNNKVRAKSNWKKNKYNGPGAQNTTGGAGQRGGFKSRNVGGPLNCVRGPPLMGGRGRLPPIPLLPPHNFRAPPLVPPISPMGRGPLPPPMGVQQLPPPFIRRNARGRPLQVPPPIPPMLPPVGRMTRSGGPPPMSFNGGGGASKIKKLNAKPTRKVVKGKSTIKTLKNIVNQYPLNKPWVTDEIRAEHAKKVDIENRLIGNKNDELFAQFKVQRDKFVGLYETARENHLKTKADTVKPKDAKKQDKVNQTTEPDANCSNQEAISSNSF